jgi:hypothetical protein
MRGGGIAVVGYGWPVIENCTVSENTTELKDGAGVGIEITIPGKRGEDLTEQGLMNRIIPWFSNGSSMSNVAVRLLAGTVGQLLLSVLIAGIQLARETRLAKPDQKQMLKWKKILKDRMKEFLSLLLYEVIASFLKEEWKTHWNEQGVIAARTKNVVIRGTDVIHNAAADDGGGLYGSAMSGIVVEGGNIANNRAVSGKGGGLRVSMGSRLPVKGVSIERATRARSPTRKTAPALPGRAFPRAIPVSRWKPSTRRRPG